MSRSASKYSGPVKPATAASGSFMAASAARTFSRSASLLSGRFRMSARPKASVRMRAASCAPQRSTWRRSRHRGIGGGEGLIDVQRARRIIEELRRRFGDVLRPQEELDYIERLLKDY